MRIVVDVMGGDHGPAVIVEGVRLALRADPAISEAYLVGQQDQIKAALRGVSDPRIRIHHAGEVMGMEEEPVKTLRRKKDCSILRAVDLLKEGRADALVATGHTGGIIAASTIRLRPLAGVDRPCIATVIPGRHHEFVLLDAGASVESRPHQLAQFAVMGSVYSREILGYADPRVGILCNGSEPCKGTETTLETYRLCKNLNLNFIGNVEGHDLFNNRVDVVVCDGFVGNIVLKTLESMAKSLLHWVKDEVTKNAKRKLGALLVKEGLRSIARRMDPDNHGGAPLLGLNGSIIKAHASARERAIMNAIGQASRAVQTRINEIIVREVAEANERLAAAKA